MKISQPLKTKITLQGQVSVQALVRTWLGLTPGGVIEWTQDLDSRMPCLNAFQTAPYAGFFILPGAENCPQSRPLAFRYIRQSISSTGKSAKTLKSGLVDNGC